MKMLKVFFVAAIVAALLSSCVSAEKLTDEAEVNPQLKNTAEDTFADGLFFDMGTEDDFQRAFFMSYLDIRTLLSGGDIVSSLDNAAELMKTLSATDVYFQVRAFGDALYASELFLPAFGVTYDAALDPGTDVLELVSARFHEAGLRVHAWVNPYRLTATNNAAGEEFVSRLLNEDKMSAVEWDGYWWLNPGRSFPRGIILEGIREILYNYEVDGVLFDDYFYPTADESFDFYTYSYYLEDGGELSLSDFRKASNDELISSTSKLAKECGVKFAVSPDASLWRCENMHFINVEKWCAEGLVDYICPQIYYGFENETMPFDKVLGEWRNTAGDIPVVAALAFCKAGTNDKFAGSGQNEWMEHGDVIARQYENALEAGCAGAAFYSFGHVFNLKGELSNSAKAERDALMVSIAKGKNR